MKTTMRKIAVIEGVPWHLYPERPVEVAKLPPLNVVHWSKATGAPYFLTDFAQNGYIVLTENGDPIEMPGWVCEYAKLPADWTYSDGEWRLSLVNNKNGFVTFVAMTL